MPTTYATAFAAHHARGSTLRPPDTTFRPRDTMVHRPTMLRARDTTTTTRSTQFAFANAGYRQILTLDIACLVETLVERSDQ